MYKELKANKALAADAMLYDTYWCVMYRMSTEFEQFILNT